MNKQSLPQPSSTSQQPPQLHPWTCNLPYSPFHFLFGKKKSSLDLPGKLSIIKNQTQPYKGNRLLKLLKPYLTMTHITKTIKLHFNRKTEPLSLCSLKSSFYSDPYHKIVFHLQFFMNCSQPLIAQQETIKRT